jgi:hypothetical protein
MWQNVDLSDDNTLSLNLVLPQGITNLHNYSGGALCNASDNCSGRWMSSGYSNCITDPLLTSGIVTTATAPEPSSTLLLGAGLASMGLMMRRRCSKK